MKKLIFAVAALLCAAVCITPFSAAAVRTRAVQTEICDYSRPGDMGYAETTAADVLARYLQHPLGDVERDYLLSRGFFTLRYSGGISSSYVSADFDGDTHLHVTARPYSYTAVNGETVVWSPVSAEGGGEVSDGTLYWQKDDVEEADGDTVEVTYAAEAEISAETINGALNAAYLAGMGASEKLDREQARYEDAYAAYLTQKEKYEAYPAEKEAYDRAEKAYTEYLREAAQWERKKADYDAYLKVYGDYLEELAAYRAYDYDAALAEYSRAVAAYEQYLAEKEEYEKKLAEYQAATASKEAQTVLYQLSLLAYIDKPVTDLKRTLSNAILGETVTLVLANREAIGVAAGTEGKLAVDRAGKVTVALRELINEYHACKTDAERYVYYIGCYDELRKNFCELFRLLDFFYTNALVRSVAAEKGKTRQLEILLAQLYYLSLALSDIRVGNYDYVYKPGSAYAAYYDETWRMGSKNHRPSDILAPEERLEDRSLATPLEGGYPAIPERPPEPAPVPPAGQLPTPPREPQAPEPVAAPGDPPLPVAAPGDPPQPVEEPILPEAYVPQEEERALSEAFRRGELVSRPACAESYFYPLETKVLKYFRHPRIVTVYFYGSRSEELPLYVAEEVEIGESVVYPYAVPTAEERGYLCEFDGWEDENGAYVDLGAIRTERSDLKLYPRFKKTPIAYPVVWVVGNARTDDVCDYGARPVYKGETPQRQASGARLYRFSGWRDGDGGFYPAGSPLPVMSDVAVGYYAVFEESYVVTWAVAGERVSEAVWEGETPVYGGTPFRAPDEYHSYRFAGWDPAPVPAYADALYTARFEAVAYVEAEGTQIPVKSAEGMYTADCSNTYRTTFKISALLALAAENGCGVAFKFPNGTLTLSASAVYEADAAGTETITFAPVRVRENFYRIAFSAAEKGRSALSGWTADLQFYGDFGDTTDVYAVDGEGEETRVRYAREGNAVTFTVRAGYAYYEIAPRFDVVALPVGEGLSVVPDRLLAREGDVVTLTLEGEMPAGRYLGSFYATASDGTRLVLENGNAFVMPHGGVSVGAVLAYTEYTVVFRSEGKALLTLTGLRYGDDISSRAPQPKKATDGEFRYLFAGWNVPLAPVTCDAEYEALFTSEPLPVETLDSNLNKIIRAAYVVLPILAVLLVALIVFLVIFLRRRKRKKKNGATMPTDPPEDTPPAPPAGGPEGPAGSGGESTESAARGQKTADIPPLPPLPPQTAADAPARKDPPMPERGEMPDAIRARIKAKYALPMSEGVPAPAVGEDGGRFAPVYGEEGEISGPHAEDPAPSEAVLAAFPEAAEAEPYPAPEDGYVIEDIEDILREFGEKGQDAPKS